MLGNLRAMHLVLGCFFAPILVLFAVTGALQIAWEAEWLEEESAVLRLVSTLHTGEAIKTPEGPATLSSTALWVFAVAMAVALVVNVLLGVWMAWKLGHRKAALASLAAGFLVPAAMVGWTCISAAKSAAPLKPAEASAWDAVFFASEFKLRPGSQTTPEIEALFERMRPPGHVSAEGDRERMEPFIQPVDPSTASTGSATGPMRNTRLIEIEIKDEAQSK